MRLTIIFTLLALFCVGQEDCPEDLTHNNGNPNFNVVAYLYENGVLVDSIVCSTAGNSGNINCDLDTVDIGYISLGYPYEDCYYDSDGNPLFDLPVELLYFEVARVDGVDVINWATVSETNNNFFKLESSVDGSAWESVDVINGSGNSQSEIKYQVKTTATSRITYYKLTQQDFDGREEEFPIISSHGELNVTVVKTVNIMGQEVDESYRGVVIDIFTDSTIRKRYQ